jgi:hypothetical protein
MAAAEAMLGLVDVLEDFLLSCVALAVLDLPITSFPINNAVRTNSDAPACHFCLVLMKLSLIMIQKAGKYIYSPACLIF